MNFVLGARGRLGRAMIDFSQKNQVIALSRDVYSTWGSPHAAPSISRYFEQFQTSTNDEERVIYVTSGLLDPSLSAEDHETVNYSLAKNIIVGASKLGFKVVTFGTVMEQVLGLSSPNPYVASKAKLGLFVGDYATRAPVLHIQLHTLYGKDLPSEFMFMGQILDALIKKEEFKMSPGSQLREYHHVHDEVQAISTLLKEKLTGTVALSHGSPVSLKALASHVFEHFGCSHLLKLGALPAPAKENFELIFKRPQALEGVFFRDTLSALVIYLQDCITAINNKEHLCPV